jgi:hypothetical protein
MSPSGNNICENFEKFKFFNGQEKVPNINQDIAFGKKFIFKKLDERSEFLQMFALRYFVYRYVNFIESNEDQLDIDYYDLYSTFLGVFELTDKSKRLIGMVRIISGDKRSIYSDVIEDIFRNLKNSVIKDFLNRPTLFPIMNTFNLPKEFLNPFNKGQDKNQNNLLEKNSKPFEISRLAIIPEYWSSKEKIEVGLHDLIILDSWKSNPKKNIYIIAIHPRTRKKYEKLGFEIIPGTTEQLYKGINQLAIAMVMNLEDYLNSPNNPYIDRCKSLFKFYLEKRYFMRDSTFLNK